MFKNLIVIIPARFGSKRLPGKPLRMINKKPLVYLTWKNIIDVVDKKFVYVATDSNKIVNTCRSYGIQTLMTSSKCKTGSDRVAQASKMFKKKTIISVQGDEPFLSTKAIKKFIKFSLRNNNNVTNGFSKIKNLSEFFSLNVPKVVMNNENSLLYMSRSPLPGSKKKIFNKSFKQICMYGFPVKILNKYYGKNKSKSHLESFEDIEILRFIENGINVKMIEVEDNIISIDTLKDLQLANKLKKN